MEEKIKLLKIGMVFSQQACDNIKKSETFMTA